MFCPQGFDATKNALTEKYCRFTILRKYLIPGFNHFPSNCDNIKSQNHKRQNLKQFNVVYKCPNNKCEILKFARCASHDFTQINSSSL